jgi:hypothetical protein
MHEQVFPLSSHLLGQIGPRAPKSRVSEKPIRREPVQNPKPRHFKPFEFFDHTGPDEAHVDDHRVRRRAGQLKMYQALFGQPATLSAHDYFGQILDSDGTVLLCLHEWGAHEHPSLMSPDHGTPGNGLLLFFRVNDFDLALQRARSLVTRLDKEPHVNPSTQTKEYSLRDPDGYYVTISALSAA